MYFNFYKLFFGRTHTSFWLIEWNGYDTSQTPLLSLVVICRRATCDIDSDIAASSFCNTVPMWEQKSPATAQQYLGLYRRHACKVDWVGLCRHAGGKDLRCFLSGRRYVLICRSSIAGSNGGMWEPGFIIICFCGLDGAQRSQSPLLW